MASSIITVSSSNPSFGHVLQQPSENNIVKLKLKKPKSWNWELSTSKSSAHIDFPRVLLYNADGELLADIGEADLIVSGKENEPYMPPHRSLSELSEANTLRKCSSFCVTSSSLRSLSNPSVTIGSSGSTGSKSFSGKISSSNTDIPQKCIRSNSVSFNQTNAFNTHANVHEKPSIASATTSKVDISDQPEEPIYIYSAKGLVKRDFNAKEFDAIRNRSNSQPNNEYAPVVQSEKSSRQHDSCRKTDPRKKNHQLDILPTPPDKISLVKCQSMAEIVENDSTQKKFKRKIRRTRSSASTKCSTKCVMRSMSSSSSDDNATKQTSKKPMYRIQKCAAGALIVPENNSTNRRVRRRQRSKSIDKIDKTHFDCGRNKGNSASDRIPKLNKNFNSTSELRSKSHPLDICSINRINEFTALENVANNETVKSHHDPTVSIKSENNRLNAHNGVASSISSNNNVNCINDSKQKKTPLNRKVSFVQLNCETANKGCIDNGHNDLIGAQKSGELNHNRKFINTKLSNRQKKMYGKLRKSATVGGFCNSYCTAPFSNSDSDTDDDDFSTKPPMRHRKRRLSQRPKSATTSYRPHGKSVFSTNTFIQLDI